MKFARTLVSVSCALALLAATPPASAEEVAADTMDIVRDAVRADKKALIATNLDLTEKEAKAFWPVYERYQNELLSVQSRLFEVIAEYTATIDTMTDERATELVNLYFQAETDRARVRRSYVEPISGILPGRKLARFFQIENKIDAVVRYETAKFTPLVVAQ